VDGKPEAGGLTGPGDDLADGVRRERRLDLHPV
jgi:hypothetical protein